VPDLGVLILLPFIACKTCQITS